MKRLEFREISCSDSFKLHWNIDNKLPFIPSKRKYILYTVQTVLSLHVPTITRYSWRENGDTQFSITELCFPIRRENVQMTAIIIRTEAHLIREGGHNIRETSTQMLVFATSTIEFQDRERKNE